MTVQHFNYNKTGQNVPATKQHKQTGNKGSSTRNNVNDKQATSSRLYMELTYQ